MRLHVRVQKGSNGLRPFYLAIGIKVGLPVLTTVSTGHHEPIRKGRPRDIDEINDNSAQVL